MVLYDDAITHYTEAVRLNPEYAEAYYNRGKAYDDKEEFDRAIQDLDKAIDLNPKYAEAYYNRGKAYDDKEEFDRAIQDYNKAIDLNPKYAEAYYNRGKAYGRKTEFDRAIQDLDKAIDLNPKYAEAYINRGAAYGRKTEFDRAIQDLDKGLETLNMPRHILREPLMWLDLKAWEQTKTDLTAAKDLGFDIAAPFHTNYKSTDLTAAKDLGFDIAAPFHTNYKSVEDFEGETQGEAARRHRRHCCKELNRAIRSSVRKTKSEMKRKLHQHRQQGVKISLRYNNCL